MLLDGIRVVDFTRLLPGPYATLRLADLGAEVIQVESAQGGDPARSMGEKVNGIGAVFQANHRSKRSVFLDLKLEADRQQAVELALSADIVLEGFRPGVADRLGIGYPALSERKPNLVYCSLTGYGQTGPYKDHAGHDLNFLAQSGVLSLFRDAHGRPLQPAIQLADLIGGMVASETLLAALIRRGITGEGAYLDVSITDALLGLLPTHAFYQQALQMECGPEQLTGSLICYHLYRTADGRTVTLAALEPKFWGSFCEGVGRWEWISEQYSGATEENPIYVQMKALFADRTMLEWEQFGCAVDCCLRPVLTVGEAISSNYAQGRGVAATDRWNGRNLVEIRTHPRFGRR